MLDISAAFYFLANNTAISFYHLTRVTGAGCVSLKTQLFRSNLPKPSYQPRHMYFVNRSCGKSSIIPRRVTPHSHE